MNRFSLIEQIQKRTGASREQVETVLEAMLDTIKETVKDGDDVTLMGFGTFTRTVRKERRGYDPSARSEIRIPTMTLPKFRPGKEFRGLLGNNDAKTTS